MRSFFLSLALVSTLTVAAEAQSARPQTREGFGISVGLGAGMADLSCDGCDFDSETGFSGYLRLGGYLRPNLFLGFESTGWLKEVQGADVTLGFYSAVAQYYPNAEKGLYLKGGLGYSMSTADDGVDELKASGLGLSGGIGYDYRVGKNMSVTPYLNYLRSISSELKVNGTATGVDLNTGILQLGVGLTWH